MELSSSNINFLYFFKRKLSEPEKKSEKPLISQEMELSGPRNLKKKEKKILIKVLNFIAPKIPNKTFLYSQ